MASSIGGRRYSGWGYAVRVYILDSTPEYRRIVRIAMRTGIEL
jgi:hypothetical protein